LSQTTKDKDKDKDVQTTKDKDVLFEKLKSEFTFVLAIIIIVAYIVFFGTIIYQSPDGGKTGAYEGLKTITATFGLIVATVVGYYFGQRPVEAAQQHALQANAKASEIKESTLPQIHSGINAYNKVVDFANEWKRNMQAKSQLTAEDNRLVEQCNNLLTLSNERIKDLQRLHEITYSKYTRN